MSTDIKTWQERFSSQYPNFPVENVDAANRLYWIGLENAELRAALALAQAPSAPVAPQAAEDWLRQRYGAARGHHAWRDLTEAFNAGAALSVKAEECTWTPTADHWETGAWDSACGETWLFTDGGTPAEHNVKFCQGCGKTVAAPTPPTTGEA